MAFLRARRGSVVWFAGIGLLAVVVAVLAAIPLLPRDDPSAEGSLVREVIGPLGPARMAEIVEELIGPA